MFHNNFEPVCDTDQHMNGLEAKMNELIDEYMNGLMNKLFDD